MGNIAFNWNGDSLTGDIRVIGGDIETGNDLYTAVLLSLFTNRRADPGDEIPDGYDWQGWWGDTYSTYAGDRIGSKWWLLVREKITPSTLTRLKQYTEQALAWMVEDQVARQVQVFAERNDGNLNRVDVLVTIYKIDGATVSFRFDDIWHAALGK